MAKRHSIKFTEEDYEKILLFCKENNISSSSFLESRISEYTDKVEYRPLQGNWATRELWILFVSYDDPSLQDPIQVSAGRRGAICEDGMVFIFNHQGVSNWFLAQECKKRILQDVEHVEAEAHKYKIDHGMG